MRFWPKPPADHDHHHAAAHSDAELRAAYDRGRRDERARHRRSPLMALTVGSAALVGGAVLALAALEGSFQNGGAVVDTQVSKAAQQAGEALHDAASGNGAQSSAGRLAADMGG
jgi:hypothetical protein